MQTPPDKAVVISIPYFLHIWSQAVFCILCASVPTSPQIYLTSVLLCSLCLLFKTLCFTFSLFFSWFGTVLYCPNVCDLTFLNFSPLLHLLLLLLGCNLTHHAFPKGFLMTGKPESLLNASTWKSVIENSAAVAEGWISWTVHSSSHLFVPKVCGPSVGLAFLHDTKSIISCVSEHKNSKIYLKIIEFKLHLSFTGGVAGSQHLPYMELAPFLI